MEAQTFLDNFGTIAQAPGGINQLQQLVLNLAVRGRLVEQDPAEEPARQLLDRISSNREELIRSLGGRRPKALPELEVPPGAVLPNGWSWARLGDLGLVNPKNVVEDGELAGFVPMELVPTELHDSVHYEERPWREIKKGYTHLADGDLAVAKITPCFENRKSMVVTGLPGGVGTGTTELHVLRPVPSCVDPGFILLLVKSPVFISGGVRRMTGTAGHQRVPRDYFSGTAVPIPPLSEQHRIVAKVEELMALCNQLETQQQTRTQTTTKLRASALDALTTAKTVDELWVAWDRVQKAWTAVAQSAEDVDQLRGVIRRLAVTGRLVASVTADGSAESMLAELRESREERLGQEISINPEANTMIRKLRKLTPIPRPVGLPTGWAVTQLLDLSLFLVDCHNKTAPYSEDGIPIIRTTNIRNGFLQWKSMKFITEETYRRWAQRCPPEPGDIIFTREAPMGEAAVIPDGERVCLGQRTMLVRPMEDYIDRNYLLIALLEPGVVERALDNAVGATVQHLRVGDVEKLPIWTPPLPEQHRIVARVDELMGLCDELEARLMERDRVGEALAASVVDAFAA